MAVACTGCCSHIPRWVRPGNPAFGWGRVTKAREGRWGPRGLGSGSLGCGTLLNPGLRGTKCPFGAEPGLTPGQFKALLGVFGTPCLWRVGKMAGNKGGKKIGEGGVPPPQNVLFGGERAPQI